MKQNNLKSQNWPTHAVGAPSIRSFQSLRALLLTVIVASAVGPLASIASSASKLKPGDIVYTDSGNAIEGGLVIKVDPDTGEQEVISSGGYLRMPFDVVIDESGQIIASDQGRLIRIDPASGSQTIIADNSSGALGYCFGIDLYPTGDILVANAQAVVGVDAVTGQMLTVSAGGHFLCPVGVAVAENGDLFVLNKGWPSQVLRVNPRNGHQKLIAEGGYLRNPQAIAMSGMDIYVTDVATSDGNFGVGRVIRVNCKTGRQTVVSEGGWLVGPVGIAVDRNGQLTVGDPYTINPESQDWYDGGIIRIDPRTGDQTLLARGHGSAVNPRGVAILPGADSTRPLRNAK